MNRKRKFTILFLLVIYALLLTGVIYYVITGYEKEKRATYQEIDDTIKKSRSRILNTTDFLDKNNSQIKSFIETEKNFFNENGNIETDKNNLIQIFTDKYFNEISIKHILEEELKKSGIPLSPEYSFSLYYCMLYNIPAGSEIQSRITLIDSVANTPVLIEGAPVTDKVNYTVRKDIIMGYGYICGYKFSIGFVSSAVNKLIFKNAGPPVLLGAAVLIISTFFFLFTIKFIIEQGRLSEIKNNILLNIKHELKTPLSTLAISAKALSQYANTSNDGTIIYYSEKIKKQQLRLQGVVQRIVDLDFTNTKNLSDQFKPEDVHEALTEAIIDFESTFPEILLSQTLGAQNTFALMDKNLFQTAIINLLDNSVKYNIRQPQIFVKTLNINNTIRVSIIDNGVGINKKNLPHIFEKFFRINMKSKSVEGIGLGLYIAKKIIKYFNGNMTVESELSKGSVFHIELPVYIRMK